MHEEKVHKEKDWEQRSSEGSEALNRNQSSDKGQFGTADAG